MFCRSAGEKKTRCPLVEVPISLKRCRLSHTGGRSRGGRDRGTFSRHRLSDMQVWRHLRPSFKQTPHKLRFFGSSFLGSCLHVRGFHPSKTSPDRVQPISMQDLCTESTKRIVRPAHKESGNLGIQPEPILISAGVRFLRANRSPRISGLGSAPLRTRLFLRAERGHESGFHAARGLASRAWWLSDHLVCQLE